MVFAYVFDLYLTSQLIIVVISMSKGDEYVCKTAFQNARLATMRAIRPAEKAAQ
jgi:hypothetical protein